MKFDIVLLTPVEVEYKAVCAYLKDIITYSVANRNCKGGTFQGTSRNYKVLVCQTGSKNTTIALAAQKIADEINPSFIFVVGIAGGVKDVQLGDIVIGTKAYDYETGKITPEGFVGRPNTYRFDEELIEEAKEIAEKAIWITRLEKATHPKVYFGPIASGNKVIADTNSEVYKILKTHLNDSLALEMEAAGFGEAMRPYHRSIRIMNIRSISDLLNNKHESDAGGSQETAAQHAAAFAFELLATLNFDKYNLQMDNKAIAKEVVNLLNLSQLGETGKEFKMPATETTNAIWAKIKAIVLEEKEVAEDEAELKGAIKSSLIKQLKKDSSLKTTLEELLKPMLEKKESNTGIHIENSNINVGGNFQLGDSNVTNNTTNNNTTNNNIGQQFNVQGDLTINVEQVMSTPSPQVVNKPRNAFKTEMRMLVAANNFKSAIEKLIKYTQENDGQLHNHAIMVSGQWNNLQRQINMQLIAQQDAGVSQARIQQSILYIIDEL